MARIEVTGNVGSEPEIKFYDGKNGSFAVASFSLAYTPREKKGTDWVDGETLWFRVSVLGKSAQSIVDAVKKGDKVKVVGAFKQSTFTGKDGNARTGLEIKAEDITLVIKSSPKQHKSEPSDSWGDSWN